MLQVSLAYVYNKIVRDMDKLVPALLGIPAPPADYKPPAELESVYNSNVAPYYARSQAVVASSAPSTPAMTPSTPKPLLSSPSLSTSSSSRANVNAPELTSEQYTAALAEYSRRPQDDIGMFSFAVLV